MKKSEELNKECQDLFNELCACFKETGWKGRYLGYCTKASNKFTSMKNKGVNTTRKLQKYTKLDIKKVMNGKILSIEDSFEKLENYPNVTERYYKRMYFLNDHSSKTEHHCVLVHSNKICLVSLALTHPVVAEKKKILKLDFQVTNKLDRLENKVSGKGKKGGQYIMPDSVLCYIECEDGTKYPVWGCIKGKLVEINQLLIKEPNLIVEKPLSQGFIAILLPSIKDLEVYKKKLLTEEQYEENIRH